MTRHCARHTAGSPADVHRGAVMNTLSWADQSAAQGDYADAIAWLDVITAIGDELPDPYPARRAFWLAAMSTVRARGEAGRDDQGEADRSTAFKAARAAA